MFLNGIIDWYQGETKSKLENKRMELTHGISTGPELFTPIKNTSVSYNVNINTLLVLLLHRFLVCLCFLARIYGQATLTLAEPCNALPFFDLSLRVLLLTPLL